MSDGSTSGVNCTRRQVRSTARQSATGQRGFAHAGHIVQQNVSPCQKRAEHMFDDRALAANGFFHFNNDGFKLWIHEKFLSENRVQIVASLSRMKDLQGSAFKSLNGQPTCGAA